MSIGVSVFLIAVGAILAFAVDLRDSGGIDLDAIGVILMVVGVLGFLLSMVMWGDAAPWATRRRVVERASVVVDDDPVLLRRGRRVRRVRQYDDVV